MSAYKAKIKDLALLLMAREGEEAEAVKVLAADSLRFLWAHYAPEQSESPQLTFEDARVSALVSLEVMTAMITSMKRATFEGWVHENAAAQQQTGDNHT